MTTRKSKPKSKPESKPRKTPAQIRADKVKAGKARYEKAKKDRFGRLLTSKGHSKAHGKPPARSNGGKFLGRAVDETDLADRLEERLGGGREDKGDTFETKGFNANIIPSKAHPDRVTIVLEHTKRKGRPSLNDIGQIIKELAKDKLGKDVARGRNVQVNVLFDEQDADNEESSKQGRGNHTASRWRSFSNTEDWKSALTQAGVAITGSQGPSRRFRVKAIEIVIY